MVSGRLGQPLQVRREGRAGAEPRGHPSGGRRAGGGPGWGAWRPFLVPAFVAALWGVNNVVIKLLLSQMAPVPLVAYRMVAACLFLVPAAWWAHPSWRPSARTWRLAALAGGLIVVVHQLLLAYGMSRSQAGVGTLILSLNPPTTSVLAALVFRERLTPAQVAGVAIGTAGVWLAVLTQPGGLTPGPGDPGLTGELLLAGAMLSYVAASLVIQAASRQEPVLAFTALSQTLGVAGLLLLLGTGLLPTGAAAPHGRNISLHPAAFWALVIASGAVSTGMGGFLWNRSIQRLGASRASLFLNGMPLSGMFAAALLLGEPVGWGQVAGLIGVMAGIALGATARRGHPPCPADPNAWEPPAPPAAQAYAPTGPAAPASSGACWPSRARRRAT